MPAMKKHTRPTNCGPASHWSWIWWLTMSLSFSECAVRTTPSTDSASETSYETICAHVRIEPRSAYLDSDSQPPTTNAQVPTEPSPKTSVRPLGPAVTTP